MSGVSTQYQVGNVSAGERSLAVLPRNWKANGSKMGVLYCHGYGGTAMECRNSASQNMWTLVEAIARAGFPVLSCDLGGDIWGNPTAVARVTTARAYLQGTLGAKAGKIALLGQSMGHLTAMNWAAANLASTACVVSSMGVCDLAGIQQDPLFQASINAAYGGTYSNATHGPASNPAVNTAAKYAGLKWLSYRGASDTIAPQPTAVALAAAIGATATANTVPGYHDWATVGNYPVQAIVDFIAENS
ncbi:alpha/beta hydrolase [Pseudarthrobacter sp. ATCC 49987]|uniref:alpha/beta hydrolase n=1 Tax=Pseudarthrobacter sp. ATCC 49987 TaxID=2698204 RepID=UPI00136A1478|nr:alpha/beta hydrolase [Pseudarthrobacter sp. ATCC 49987]